jgi:hypothetical protein
MTENEPQNPEVDDLGLTSEDWCCAALRMPMKAALAVPMWGR